MRPHVAAGIAALLFLSAFRPSYADPITATFVETPDGRAFSLVVYQDKFDSGLIEHQVSETGSFWSVDVTITEDFVGKPLDDSLKIGPGLIEDMVRHGDILMPDNFFQLEAHAFNPINPFEITMDAKTSVTKTIRWHREVLYPTSEVLHLDFAFIFTSFHECFIRPILYCQSSITEYRYIEEGHVPEPAALLLLGAGLAAVAYRRRRREHLPTPWTVRSRSRRDSAAERRDGR